MYRLFKSCSFKNSLLQNLELKRNFYVKNHNFAINDLKLDWWKMTNGDKSLVSSCDATSKYDEIRFKSDSKHT